LQGKRNQRKEQDMGISTEAIATAHLYKIFSTIELTEDQERRIADLLGEFTRESGASPAGGGFLGKYAERPMYDFSPQTAMSLKAV
jgi:hypothetical protein